MMFSIHTKSIHNREVDKTAGPDQLTTHNNLLEWCSAFMLRAFIIEDDKTAGPDQLTVLSSSIMNGEDGFIRHVYSPQL